MAWTATDTFESYSNGDLNGLNGGSGFSGAWSGDTSYDVQSTTVYQGSKAITCAGLNVDMVRSLTTPVTDGILKVAFRSSQFANNVGGFVLKDQGGGSRIRITGEVGAIRLQNGAQSASVDIVGSAAANTWYEIHVEIDAANDRARARLVGGGWTSWLTVEAFTSIDSIRLTTASDSSGSMLIDDIGAGSAPAASQNSNFLAFMA